MRTFELHLPASPARRDVTSLRMAASRGLCFSLARLGARMGRSRPPLIHRRGVSSCIDRKSALLGPGFSLGPGGPVAMMGPLGVSCESQLVHWSTLCCCWNIIMGSRHSVTWVRHSVTWIRQSVTWIRHSVTWIRQCYICLSQTCVTWIRHSVTWIRHSVTWIRPEPDIVLHESDSVTWVRHSVTWISHSVTWIRQCYMSQT